MKLSYPLTFLVGLLLTSCSTFDVGIERTPTILVTIVAPATSTAVSSPEPQPTFTAAPAIAPSLDLNSTAGWKTYTNTKYGFTFKYPPTLDINKGPASEEPDEVFQTWSQVSFTGPLILNDAASLITFDIMAPEGTDPNIRCTDDQDCLDKFLTSGQAPQAPIRARVKANILGRSVDGLEYSYPLYSGHVGVMRCFAFAVKGQMWTALAYFGLKSDQTQDPYARMLIFNQILDTFELAN